jgi:hypothetical protein
MMGTGLIILALLVIGLGAYIGLLQRRLATQKAALDHLNQILERETMIDEGTGLLKRRQLEVEI